MSDREVDAAGFTLIEMMLSVLVLSVIIIMSMPTVQMFYSQSATVQNTFMAANQVLLASEILTEYTHDGVASCPAPPGDASCSTANGEQPFVTATSTSATFFADTNDTSTTTGPVKVTISLTGTTLSVTVAKPTSGSCPLTSTPSTVCAYGAAKTIATVYHETDPNPLSYLIGNGGQQVGASCDQGSIANPTTSPINQVGEIVGMCIDLDAQLKGGQQAGYQSLAYLLSPAYNQNVG